LIEAVGVHFFLLTRIFLEDTQHYAETYEALSEVPMGGVNHRSIS
jgi:hypothetical protein